MNKAKRVSSGKKTENVKKRSAEATHNSGKNKKAEIDYCAFHCITDNLNDLNNLWC